MPRGNQSSSTGRALVRKLVSLWQGGQTPIFFTKEDGEGHGGGKLSCEVDTPSHFGVLGEDTEPPLVGEKGARKG